MASNVPFDGVLIRNARMAVAAELKKKRTLKQPIAKFDPKTKQIYMENPDGSVKVLGNAMTKGRYSERHR